MNNEQELDEILIDFATLLYMKDGQRGQLEAKQQLLEWGKKQRIDELDLIANKVKPQDKHLGASWHRGYVTGLMKLRKVIKKRKAELTNSEEQSQ